MRFRDPNGPWKQHPARSAPARAARPRRDGRRLLARAARRHGRGLRRRHDRRRAGARGARFRRQLPGRSRDDRQPDRRHASHVGAGSRRLCRRDRAPAQHRGARHLPHLRRTGADAAGESRRAVARAGSPGVRNAGREGGGADRVYRDFVPRPSQRGSRAPDPERVRLALRSAGPLLVHHGVLESADGRRHFTREHDCVRLALGFSPGRGRGQAPALERPAPGRRRLRRLAALRSSAARVRRDRRVRPDPLLVQRPLRPPRAGSRAAQRVARLPRPLHAAAVRPLVHGRAGRREPVATAARRREHRLAADPRDRRWRSTCRRSAASRRS